MIQIHTVPAAFFPEDCARITAMVEAAPAQDAGLVRNATDHNLRRADLVWLCDPASHNVTGTAIPVDGGWTTQ